MDALSKVRRLGSSMGTDLHYLITDKKSQTVGLPGCRKAVKVDTNDYINYLGLA